LWANRFGDLSAVRYAATGLGVTVLREELKTCLSPQALGLFFFPARQQALESVAKAMNFGELFVSMSFVLIAAALMLAGLLFVFNVEQRAEEAGILRAIGFLPYHTMALFLAEGAVVALAGSAVGAVIGTAYTRLLVWGLSGEWRGAVAGSSIVYHAEAGSAAAGAAAAAVCSVFAMALALRKQTKRQARELLSGDAGVEAPRAGGGRRGLVISTALIAAAIAVIAASAPDDAGHRVAGFFSAGAMLLIGGMGLVRNRLGALALRESGRITLREIGIRGAARRRGRSLAAAGLLACGCFIVFAVLAMQQDVTAGARLRSSGTGGFGIYAESTIPVVDRLETEQGRSAFKLGEGSLSGLSFVSMKIRDGDDASCFNLNRAMAPRLVGVVPEAMSGRGAFVARDGADPWKLLDEELPDGLGPGLVGDVNTAMWGLQKKTGPEKGDVLAYKDERGDMFGVKLVGSLPQHLSVMQGVVLVSAARFSEKFPSEEGYRAFLADVPEGADPVEAARLLGTRMARAGLDAVPAAQRLVEFYSVESTYLSMFMALGGFGLLLGTAGMGVVVLRNVLERRRELSAMRCMGFMRGDLVRMLLIEHAALLAAGVAIGAASSLAAVWPNVSGGESWAQGGRIVLFLAGILVSGLLWIALSARIGLRGDMLAGLRDE